MSAVLSPLDDAVWTIVPAKDIEAVWPHVRAGVEQALERCHGEATEADTKAYLLAGRTHLALLSRGDSTVGIVFMFIYHPRYKIARVLLLFGERMSGLAELMESAERWAKSQGCRYVEGWVGSRSRERLFSRFGYEDTYTILRKELT